MQEELINPSGNQPSYTLAQLIEAVVNGGFNLSLFYTAERHNWQCNLSYKSNLNYKCECRDSALEALTAAWEQREELLAWVRPSRKPLDKDILNNLIF